MAFGLALWGTLIVSGADNVLRPLLLKGETHLHPLLTFLAVLGGLIYFGFLGFILGLVVLSFLMTLFDIYKRELIGNTRIWTQIDADYHDFEYEESLFAGICENLPPYLIV